MNIAGLLNKFFGLSNKQVDYFATIFAAVILSSEIKYDDEMEAKVEEDAKKLFKNTTTQGFFVSQVRFLAMGGANGVKDLNALIKIINQNSKLYKKWNPRIPYYLLNHYIVNEDIQKRVFEFLYTLKEDNSNSSSESLL